MSNYEQEHASFTLAVPEFFNFGFDVVDTLGGGPVKTRHALGGRRRA